MQSSRLLRRLWDFAGGVSVRVKVLGIVLGVILMLSSFVIVQMRLVLTDKLLDELAEQAFAIADGTAQQAAEMLAEDERDLLVAYLRERQEHYSSGSHNTEVVYILVEGVDGTLLASAPDDLPPVETAYATDRSFVPYHHQLIMGDQLLEVIAPLPEGNGAVWMGLARRNIQRTVNSVTVQLLATTLLMVVVGFVAAFFLTWILTRPILELVAAAQAVGRGDFSRRVRRWANDEIGQLASTFNAMTASLQQAEAERAEREELRERYVSGVILAQENERQRIARELHDSTSQSLTSLLVGLQNLKLAKHDGDLAHQIDELRGVVGQTLEEVRTLSWRLRPTALDDLGLVSALQHYIEDYQRRYGLHVDYITRGIHDRLPPEMETSIYRIVQEGLTNIARYAQATHASVIISRRNGLLRVIIEDDGVGFDPEVVRHQNKSLGLQGIRERSGLLGGNLTIESQPGQGTSLFVEIPYGTAQEEG